MADVGELVGHHQADLVALVAVDQGVEEDDALGRTQPGDVGVGRGGAPARVHRVDLADADAGLAGQGQDVRAQLTFGQRLEVVEDRVEDHRGQRGQPGAEHHRPGAHRRPPRAREAPRDGDDRGARRRRRRRSGWRWPWPHPRPTLPRTGCPGRRPSRAGGRSRAAAAWAARGPATARRRRRRRQSAAPGRPGTPQRRGRAADDPRQGHRVDQAPGQPQRQLGPGVAAATVDLIGARSRSARRPGRARGRAPAGPGGAARSRRWRPPEAPARGPERVNACSPARL